MTRYITLVGALAMVIGLWAAGTLGVFRLPNAILYDYCTRLSTEKTNKTLPLLLIEADQDAVFSRDTPWMQILDSIENLQPEKILFSFFPPNSAKAFYQKTHEYGNVIFGRRISGASEGADGVAVEPIPDIAAGPPLVFGYLSVFPPYYGVHRWQRAGYVVDGRVLPAFETAALPDGAWKEMDRYRVNFIGKQFGLPKISLQRAMSGDLLPALVKDRYILIGVRPSSFEAGIRTPVFSDKGISRLEFHGFALNTLLSGELITDISEKWSLLMIGGMVFLVCLMSGFVSIGLLTWAAIPIGALVLAATWLLLVRFSIWIPAAELLVALLLTTIFNIRTRSVQQEQHIRSLLYQVSSKTKERLIPESFYDSEEPWTYIMAMMDQTLNTTRSILLEPLKKGSRVKEIKALNCSIEDIHERRRDYHREPYSAAISENSMIQLDRRPFFKTSIESENQYLVPLSYAGRLLGFWAFGMLPAAEADIPNFKTVISDFGGRIGELLYRREYRRNRTPSNRIEWRQYLLLSPPHGVDRDLNHALTLLERRLNLLDAAFDSTRGAIIMYDHFGQILHINKPMSQLIEQSGLPPYRTTAAEFVARTTQASPEEIRQLLRQFLFERKSASMPAILPETPNRHYMLHIQSLFLEDQRMLSEFAYPFHAYGFMMELNEVTELKMFSQLKNELQQAVDHRLRTDMELIRFAVSLVCRPDFPAKEKVRAAAVLERRVDELAEYLETAGEDMAKDVFSTRLKEHPIDPRHPMRGAIEAVQERAASRQIAIEADLPETANLVCIDYQTLTDTVRPILTMLIDDAVENSAIHIDMIETGKEFICSFSNTGFGMPDHLFKEYLFGNSEVSYPEFVRLRAAASEIEKKGGRLNGRSEMGVGTRFNIHLVSRFCNSPSLTWNADFQAGAN